MPKAKVERSSTRWSPRGPTSCSQQGDELSLREAAELEPRRADVAVALGRARLERGAEDEALEAVEPHPERLRRRRHRRPRSAWRERASATEAFAALDRGEREAALDQPSR